ncbi:MAG: hypothetical protein E5Y34_12975 [Mesorhizobium sp.]|uniref:hypothetical protein n=1 Tax=Mesorhizobium sp. TaxID=1871066 RepID=UPI00121A6A4B|nr:hypothetical protein [Mesorhizobium sp.]TIN00222.1 MAG: hypothetical protein E5Y34_12975 [Mesorhizobium sp.]
MVAKGEIPHDDYKSGFIAGFQSVKRVMAAIPAIPAQPATPAGLTPFLMGVRKGIQKATGKSWDEITE